MALNFLGLGFSLGAQDKGLAGAIKETSSGLADISKSVVGIGLASAKMIFKPPDLGPTVGVAKTLLGDVKTTTTALEAYGVTASKATSAGLAGLNLTDKEFRQAKSTIADAAFSMNTDVGSVTKSFSALAQAGVKVTDIGFSSFEEYQQFLEVTGTDAQAFAGAIGTMNKQMGMSNKQITASIKSVASIGKKFNIGREAIAGMADTVKVLNENSNLLPQNWSPAKMDKFLKGTTVVAGAFTSVGLTADEAMAASRHLTQKLLEGSKGLAGMYSGLKNQLPDVYDVVTQNLGDVDSAFKMLSESPDQFMLKMGNLVDQVNKMNLDPQAMDRFRLQMEQTFGPEVMTAFTKKGFGKIGPAIQEASKPMAGQEKVLSNLASRYEDGRTHADRFAIVQDRVQTKLKQLNGVMSDTKYLHEYTRQTNDFIKSMSKLASQKGPVGKATALLIDFKNRGVGGALAAHFKWGFALSEGMKVMQPFLAYLPALKVAFMALMNPIGMVAAAIAGLFFVFRDLKKGKDSIIRPLFDKVVNEAPKLINKVIEIATNVFEAVWGVLRTVDWNKVVKTVLDAFTKVFNVIFKVVEMIDWNKVGQVLGQVLIRAADVAIMLFEKALNLLVRIVRWIGDLDWGAIGKVLGGILAKAGDVAITFVLKVFGQLPEIMTKIIEKAVSAVTGVLDGIRDYLVKKFPDAAKPIVFIVEMLKVAVKIVGSAFKLSWDAIVFVVKKLWAIVKGVGEAIGFVVGKLIDAGEYVGHIASKVGGFFSSVGSGIKSLFSSSDNSAINTSKLVQTQLSAIKKQQDMIASEQKRRHDEWVQSEHKAGRATEGYVKTVEGEIIKSTDALVRYERDATGTIQKVAHAAANYTKAIVGGEAYEQMEKMQADIRAMSAKAQKSAKAGSDEWHAAMDDAINTATSMHEEYMKKWGVRWDVMYRANEEIQKQFAIENSVVAAAKNQGMGYYTALTSLQTKLAEQTGVVRLKMEQLRQQGKEGTEEFKKLEADYIKMSADGISKLQDYKDILAGDLAKTMDMYVKDSKDKILAAERGAYVLAEAFKAEANSMLAKLPEGAQRTKEVVLQMTNDLAEAQKKELNNFLAHTELKGKELNAAVSKITQHYKDEQDKITQILKDNNRNLVIGAEDQTLKALGEVQKGYSKMVKEVNVKTSEAAGEIQKQFGVSADAALDSVNQIAAIDPNIFRKNMAVVKSTFMGFLRDMDTQGKKLLDNTTKSFNTLWQTMNDGWKKHTDLLDTFTKKADETITKFWQMIVDKAAVAASQLIQITDSITVALKAMFNNINLMDLLASPDQVAQWAASVVSALAYAFRSGGAADAMIGASYQKALAMAGEIQRSAGPATPDTSKNATSPAASSVTAASELLRTMNHPAWATDKKELIPSQLEEMNQNLQATLEALRKLAEGRAAAPPRTPAPKPRIH